jgi:hypothetical protein
MPCLQMVRMFRVHKQQYFLWEFALTRQWQQHAAQQQHQQQLQHQQQQRL